MRSKMKSQRVQLGEINSQIEDTLLGIRLVKSFTNEAAEINKFEERNNRYLKYINTLWISVRTLANFTEQFQQGITGIER
jgi:ATP-binding cassette subfamily B protein